MIRQIQLTDIRRVGEIWLKVSIDIHSFIGEHIGVSPLEFWSGKLPEMLQTTLGADGYVYAVDGQIMGFLTITPKNSCGYYMYELFVDSPFQGKGIVGPALVNFAKSLGTYLKTNVYQKNERAIRFYLKHGFSKLSEEPYLEQETQQLKFWMIWWKGDRQNILLGPTA
jgi:putative acetyltransferase